MQKNSRRGGFLAELGHLRRFVQDMNVWRPHVPILLNLHVIMILKNVLGRAHTLRFLEISIKD